MGYWRAGYFRKKQVPAVGYWREGYWRDDDFEVTTPDTTGGDSSAAKYLLDRKRRLQRLYRDDEDVLSILIAFLTSTGGRK